MGRCLVALALCGACSARLGPFTSDNNQIDAGRDSGSGIDAPAMLGPWGTPMSITGANSAVNGEDDGTLSSTALEIIYAVATPTANKDLYAMTRATRNDPFGAPAALPATINTTGTEESPRLSVDDLTLYFGRDGDIFRSTRATLTSPWQAATIVAGSGNTANYEKWLAVCGTNHFMVSRDNGSTDQDLYEGTLGTAGTLVAELNSGKSEISTFLSPDCLTVYFASNRGTQTAIYMSTRATMATPWSTPTAVPAPFDAGTDNEDAWISTDQRIFVWSSVRNGATTKDLYISTR